MFGPDRHDKMLGAEILRREPAQAKRHVGQSGIEPRQLRIRDEPRRIDNGLPGLEFRLQQVRKDFQARKRRLVFSRHMNADRTRELVVNVQSENPSILRVVISIGEHLGKIRRDRALAQVGLVAQPRDRLTILAGQDAAAVNPVEERRDAIRKTDLRRIRQRYRTHYEPFPPRPLALRGAKGYRFIKRKTITLGLVKINPHGNVPTRQNWARKGRTNASTFYWRQEVTSESRAFAAVNTRDVKVKCSLAIKLGEF